MELWPWFPTPLLWAVGKVFTYRKFGSFLHPQHKLSKKSGLSVLTGEQESCRQQSGPGAPGTWDLIFPQQGLPSLTPSTSGPPANWPNTGTQVLCGLDRRPFVVQSGRTSPAARPGRVPHSQQAHPAGRESPQHPLPKPLPPAQYCSLE